MEDKRDWPVIKKIILDNLMIMGIPAHLRGFLYIFEIICYLLIINEERIIFKNDIYKMVAEKYNTSEDGVERDIRYAIDIGYSRTQLSINEDSFKNSICVIKNKPTNKQFIMTVSNRIQFEIRTKLD
jgi:two-component system response regulator (stage 0 sporulation protein A)